MWHWLQQPPQVVGPAFHTSALSDIILSPALMNTPHNIINMTPELDNPHITSSLLSRLSNVFFTFSVNE